MFWRKTEASELAIYRITKGEGVWRPSTPQKVRRYSTQRFGIAGPLGQSLFDYGSCRSAALTSHLSRANGGGRWFCRLRTTLHAVGFGIFSLDNSSSFCAVPRSLTFRSNSRPNSSFSSISKRRKRWVSQSRKHSWCADKVIEGTRRCRRLARARPRERSDLSPRCGE